MIWTSWLMQAIIVEKFVKQPREPNKWCDCFNSSKRDALCTFPKHLFMYNHSIFISLQKTCDQFLQQSYESFLLNVLSLSSSIQFGKFRNIVQQLLIFLGFGLDLQIIIFNLHLTIELTGDFGSVTQSQPSLSYQVTVVRMKLGETSYKKPWTVREKWDLNPSFIYWFIEFL